MGVPTVHPGRTRKPGPNFVGYWLVVNRHSGHALVSYGNNATSPAILKALGARSAADVHTYGWAGDFFSGITAGLAKLGANVGEIPTKYMPHSGTDIMPLNMDLAGAPLGDPNFQQQTQVAGAAAEKAVQTAGGLFSALFGSLAFWKGIGLILGGAAILVFAALEARKL